MNYIIKLIKSLKIVIITTIIPYLITFITSFIYIKIFSNNIEYYINHYLIYIILIYYITTILYLTKKYKINYKIHSLKNYYIYLSLGISISCILNMIIFLLTNRTTTISINPIIIISSSLIGPIYEEIIFRHIFYNNLKNFNSPKISIIIDTIIFSIIHLNIIKIIYSFILGLILNITYEKKKKIIYPILIHIGANIISLFLTEYNTLILSLSLFLLIININNLKLVNK